MNATTPPTSSYLKLAGIPLLITNEGDGRNNFTAWKPKLLTYLKSEGLYEHIAQPYAKVDAKFNGQVLTSPLIPMKYEPWKEQRGESPEDRVVRRAAWREEVTDYNFSIGQYEKECVNYSKYGQDARQVKFDVDDNKVLAIINATVDPTVAASFPLDPHAHDLWLHLVKTFGTASQLSLSALYRELLTTLMEEGTAPRAKWEYFLRVQAELKGSMFDITLALLQINFLLLFAQIPLYNYVYQKFRALEFKDEIFNEFLTELTITFQDNGGAPTGSTPAMYGRGGVLPPAQPPSTENSNDCHAKVKCAHCSETGHIKENCRKWRQANPKVHVKTVTEPKRNKGDPKASVSGKVAEDVDEGVEGGMACPAVDVPFDDDTAVDGC